MNIIHSKHLKSAGSFAIVLRTLSESCFYAVGKYILILLCYTYTYLLELGSLFRKYLPWVKTLWAKAKTANVSDAKLIKNEVILFQKIPQHLTLIVGAECPSYKDLIKFIKWCIPSGISHVSFYDYHNRIDSEDLFKYLCEFEKQYIPSIKWGKSFSEKFKEISVHQINGFSWKPEVTVHIYTKEDWLGEVEGAVEDVTTTDPKVSCKVSSVDAILRHRFLAPDPDLAMVFGPVLSFFGFPPWYLRITQILNVPSHHNITLETFLDGLRKYSSCQQRYGK